MKQSLRVFNQVSGNALFLVLIAVALFAALGYAVTQSSRGVTGVNKEEADLQAAIILQASEMFKANLLRFMLGNNFTIHQVSFFDGSDWNYRENPYFPVPQRMFYTNGGGYSWPEIPSGIASGTKFAITTASHVPGLGHSPPGCTGSKSCAELFLLRGGVPVETCMALNRMNGIINTDGKPPVDSGDFESIKFKPDADPPSSGNMAFDGTDDENFGKHFGCLETTHAYRGGPGKYYFYYVLLPDVHL